MNVFLLYRQYFDKVGKERKLGGIETYMDALCTLFHKKKIVPIICQFADILFERKYNGVVVKGYPVDNIQKLYGCIEKDVDKNADLILFMTDALSFKLTDVRSMSIQHGVAWDIPYSGRTLLRNSIGRLRYSWYGLRDFLYCDSSVCVDYNFYNWYKAIYPNSNRKRICVIPNFARQILTDFEVEQKIAGFGNKTIRVIFARRFEEFRGSILFARVMRTLLEKYPRLEVTIAGEGPCEEDMRQILADYSNRVTITKYLPSEAFCVHKEHDIAVVPTIGSEGTSLSLIEAMAAGCLAVSTPVGGMSNIIIDGYNGLYSMPEEEEMTSVIEKAVQMIEAGDGSLVRRAVETIRVGFGIDSWERKWSIFLDSLFLGNACNGKK